MCVIHVILANAYILRPFHSHFLFLSFFFTHLPQQQPITMTTAATTNTRKKTFSMQHTVPRLPIPSLEESCALYLQSLRPLLSPDEYQKSATLVQDFVNSDLGKSLQQRLADIDQASPYNWLEDNFWLRKGKSIIIIIIISLLRVYVPDSTRVTHMI